MNELLEKARQMYPIGTKFKSMFDLIEHTITKNLFTRCGNIYTYDDKFEWITIYDLVQNRWAEIIKEETVNNLLEKAKRDYPIGTKVKSVKDGAEHISTRINRKRFSN